jgi:hypothetical protein
MEGLDSGVRILSYMWYVLQKYTPHVNFGTLVLVHVFQKLLRTGLLTSNYVKLF